MKDELLVCGTASGKVIIKIDLKRINNRNLTLLELLTKNKITIASSCAGAGECKKCVVNQNVLSCQILLEDYLKNFNGDPIRVSYL